MRADITLRPACVEDARLVADLLNKEALTFTGSSDISADELKTEWTVPGFDLARDTRIAVDADGRVVGYADFYNIQEPPVRPFAYLAVDPDTFESWEWKALIPWLEQRARQDIPRAPEDARFSLVSGNYDRNVGMITALEEAGFQEARRFYEMRIEFDGPPPAAKVAPGYEIRVMRPGEERNVYDALQVAFRDHYGVVPPEDPDKAFKRWMHFFISGDGVDPELHVVALDAHGNVVGGSICRPTHAEDMGMAWVNSLAVVKAHRRKGLGEALLRRSFENFYAKGKPRAGLGVDASSLTNATRLYTKCGMRQTKVFVEVVKVLRDGRELANLG